ncbi:MAG TPA: winged helix-turn-helix domain-containing protein [Acetobacteraceae bacterium]|jgi:TolB-like protein/DNA-binding winged helix-turn-helix (wHTH) protein/Tfp pilus assembly protein PilF
MTAPNPSGIFVFGEFRFDRRSGGLFRCAGDGKPDPVTIGSRALDVLGVLVARHGDLVSKDEILAAAWPDTTVDEANLHVQISALRRVLDQDRAGASCIQTVPGRGYRFVAEVMRVAAGAPMTAADAAPVPDVGAKRTRPAPRNFRRFGLLLIGLVAAAGAAAWLGEHGWFRSEAGRARLSIVVLPFANIGSDPEQEYLADAITDDLTTDLSRISGSVVIAHSTAQTYRGKAVDVRQIGHELDVHYVLEGSVRRMGEQVEVNAQLIDAGSGTHAWADRFATDRRNLAEAQREITGRLAHTLDLQLVAADDRRIQQMKRADPDAADLAMRGWALWFQPFSVATREKAARAFAQALEIDPQSVDAKIGAATILVSNIGVGSSRSPQQDGARAERLLLEAIEQDANSSRAHEVLGTLRRIQARLDEARIEFETAIALDRNNAHAMLGLGQTLMFLGRPADGIPPIENSMRLDPRDPNIAFGHWSLGACQLLLGHIDKAADLLRTARAENPRVYFFHIYLAAALGLHGDIDEARAALTEAVRLNPAASSLARLLATQPWLGNPVFATLRNSTFDLGLRRAGMPDT